MQSYPRARVRDGIQIRHIVSAMCELENLREHGRNTDSKQLCHPVRWHNLLILWWARRDSNPRPRDYESPALTAELQALQSVTRTAFPTVAKTVAGGSTFGSASAFERESCKRSKARSTASGLGWTYRCETVMLLCPAIRMMVKASTPDSPSLVSIVWRRE